VVFTKQDSPLKSVEDCQKPGLTIAVLLGSTGETDAKKNFPNAKLKSYKGGGPLLIDAVLKGHADFGVNDASAVTGQMSNFPPNSGRILPGMLSKLPLAFAVRYDFLHIRLDGRMDENLNYWVNSLDWKKDH